MGVLNLHDQDHCSYGVLNLCDRGPFCFSLSFCFKRLKDLWETSTVDTKYIVCWRCRPALKFWS